MRIQPINGTSSFFGPEQSLTSVSHALAEARKAFRAAAPHVSWASVHAEASRVRGQDSMTMLESLYTVYNRLITGAWTPQPVN